MQLNKYLAQCGVASRRKANSMIQEGRVGVNQEIVKELGRVIDTQKDHVFLDGHRLNIPNHYCYLLMNKPDGVITAVEDDRGRKTVIDMIRYNERVFPVGRLDLDTEGVLLLTNDGELTYRLTHPKFEIEKVYAVWVKGLVQPKSIQKLNEGVAISDHVIVRGNAKIVRRCTERTLIEMRIHEGKKRQVKRMMKAVGHPVIHLKRIVFAGLTVDDLQLGACRELTEQEIQFLYEQVGLERN